jgi:hypothetical protein
LHLTLPESGFKILVLRFAIAQENNASLGSAKLFVNAARLAQNRHAHQFIAAVLK